jgi:hypothetical protein
MGKVGLDRGGVVQKMKMMYYPFVNPPRAVLWQALLYWDELTRISPEVGYQFRRDLLVLRDLGCTSRLMPMTCLRERVQTWQATCARW